MLDTTPFDPRYGVLAAISAAFGALTLKLLDHILSSRDRKQADGKQDERARQSELREDIRELRALLKEAEASLVEWREKHYALLDELSNLKSRLGEANERIQALLADLEALRLRIVETSPPPSP